jgi:hypothetical protein
MKCSTVLSHWQKRSGGLAKEACLLSVERRQVGRISGSANDEAFRRRANVAEGIASDQSQAWLVRPPEDSRIVRANDFGGFDPIAIRPFGRREGDFIVPLEVPQPAEKCVAMSGNRYISRLTRDRSPGNVSCRHPEDARVNTFQDN